MCQWASQQPGGWEKELKKNWNSIFKKEGTRNSGKCGGKPSCLQTQKC